MPIRKRAETREPTDYFGLVEGIIDVEPGNGYSRSFLLLDCVRADAFRNRGVEALLDKSSLALVRAMSTPLRWDEWFGLGDLAEGDWLAFTLDDSGDSPRAWELPADLEYRSRPPRSVRAMRRLGRGEARLATAQEDQLAFKLARATDSAGPRRRAKPLAHFLKRLPKPSGAGIEITILDVGQASAALISNAGKPLGLFDAGAPIWFNKGSRPKGFIPPAITDGFIFVSHWDFDHFELGRSHSPYRQLAWFAPDQIVGPNTAKFQRELGPNLTFVDGGGSRNGFTLARGTSTVPKDRNGTGYQLRYDADGRAALLTGDTDYSHIQPAMLAALDRLSIPHHAGRCTTPPPASGQHPLAVASFGSPNSYRHPHPATMPSHVTAGWQVSSTAAGTAPRGNRLLFP